ncbi:hypothetical protein L0Y59_03485 [Candidatus Uhrbacteria bacterium]|nr:hypothetical protein [Candidatus Uhrbacteria bacterium]
MLIIVGSAIVYLILTIFIGRTASWRLRTQLPSILGHRGLEAFTDPESYVIYLFPLRWHEQILWPLWLPVALVMKAFDLPKPVPAKPRQDRRERS